MRKLKKFINKCVGGVVLILTLSMLTIIPGNFPLVGVQSAYAYNDRAHKWIIRKAIEYLKQRGSTVVSEFPLDHYLSSLDYGVWYADQAIVEDEEFNCTWDWGSDHHTSNCDTIHHYGFVDDIELSEWQTMWADITVAHPGEFAAPYYAEVLFDLAVKFWPGGLSVPRLSELPIRSAGHIQTEYLFITWDSGDLGYAWVGSLPFCEQWVRSKTGEYVSNACPKWPPWATKDNTTTPIEQRYKVPQESAENAMKYLGWAIHMVEDLTVPYHAQNRSDTEHQEYEDAVDNWINEGVFNHLPVPITGSYKESNLSVSPDYFDKEDSWSANQFALEARRVGSEMYFYTFFEGFKPAAEHCVDTAIKLVAALIEKYFMCAPPSSGDWVIPNKCICSGSRTVPANVLVPDGVVLIVPDGVTLDVDFKNHHLKVKKGGGVLVRKGGKIH